MTKETYIQADQTNKSIVAISKLIEKVKRQDVQKINFVYRNTLEHLEICSDSIIIGKIKALVIEEYSEILKTLEKQFDKL